MPAVYPIDLIAKRDKTIKMNSTIVKGWNVHYQTLEEAEEEEKRKSQKAQRKEVSLDNPAAAAEKPTEKTAKQEETADQKDQGYNAKTGSYSGHYGKEPVHDEDAKQQIHAILNEKKDAFHSALSELQQEHL